MKRVLAVLAAVVVVASAATGALIWRLPSIHRRSIRRSARTRTANWFGSDRTVYCDVVNLNDCENPQTVGELAVDGRHPVQLSVPPAIAGAPWLLGRTVRGFRRARGVPAGQHAGGHHSHRRPASRKADRLRRPAAHDRRRPGQATNIRRGTRSGRCEPSGLSQLRDRRAPVRLPASDPAACHRQRACRPTPPGRAE